MSWTMRGAGHKSLSDSQTIAARSKRKAEDMTRRKRDGTPNLSAAISQCGRAAYTETNESRKVCTACGLYHQREGK